MNVCVHVQGLKPRGQLCLMQILSACNALREVCMFCWCRVCVECMCSMCSKSHKRDKAHVL